MECPICFYKISFKDKKWSCKRCKQILHTTCFEQWNKNCPMCRYETITIETMQVKYIIVVAFACFLLVIYKPIFVVKTCTYSDSFWWNRTEVCHTKFQTWKQEWMKSPRKSTASSILFYF